MRLEFYIRRTYPLQDHCQNGPGDLQGNLIACPPFDDGRMVKYFICTPWVDDGNEAESLNTE